MIRSTLVKTGAALFLLAVPGLYLIWCDFYVRFGFVSCGLFTVVYGSILGLALYWWVLPRTKIACGLAFSLSALTMLFIGLCPLSSRRMFFHCAGLIREGASFPQLRRQMKPHDIVPAEDFLAYQSGKMTPRRLESGEEIYNGVFVFAPRPGTTRQMRG